MNALETRVSLIVTEMSDAGVAVSAHDVRRLLRKLSIVWGDFQKEYIIKRDFHYIDKRNMHPVLHRAVKGSDEPRGKTKPIKGTEFWDVPLYLEPLKRFMPVIEDFASTQGFPARKDGRSYRIRADGKGRTTPPHQKLALLISQYFEPQYTGEHWETAYRALRSELSDCPPRY
ncbi:hypothetical protein [uncultured Tateyamaria sp.]|uniref:hypothetical protein n=1 Tax=uncultured Tateyamaria sp. TaxID=455651 RepID=UPI002629BE5D|nr:hypothetical protein [uncultured Tateyamaria sp.]